MGRLQVCLEPTNNPYRLDPLPFFEKIGKKETIAKAITIICRCSSWARMLRFRYGIAAPTCGGLPHSNPAVNSLFNFER
jgi:hypothetical protein